MSPGILANLILQSISSCLRESPFTKKGLSLARGTARRADVSSALVKGSRESLAPRYQSRRFIFSFYNYKSVVLVWIPGCFPSLSDYKIDLKTKGQNLNLIWGTPPSPRTKHRIWLMGSAARPYFFCLSPSVWQRLYSFPRVVAAPYKVSRKSPAWPAQVDIYMRNRHLRQLFSCWPQLVYCFVEKSDKEWSRLRADFIFVCSFDSAPKLGVDLWILMAVQDLDLNASTRVRTLRKRLLKVMAFRAGIGVEGRRGVQDPLLFVGS